MLPYHVALVSETSQLEFADVAPVAAALQKQVIRDFAPIWGITSTVDAFAKLEDVPLDYWPVMVRDDIGVPGAAGIHEDKDGQPFALVQLSNQWELTAGHEVLEMLADPFGRRLVAGPSLKSGQGRVQYLVEVCDPSEDAEFAYTINGITVSDFYTPQYFDPVKAPSVRYSFTGAITKPRQVLRGGYLSWLHPPTRHWWQQTWFSGDKPIIRDLGLLTGTASFRSQMDRLTTRPEMLKGLPTKSKLLTAALTVRKSQEEPLTARANALRACVEEVKKTAGA